MHSTGMETRDSTTLANVLKRADELPWSHALFIEPVDEDGPSEWAADARCAVLEPGTSSDPDRPTFAVEQDLDCALDMGTVQEIVANARDQKADISTKDLLRAFNYYYDHDAFLDF